MTEDNDRGLIVLSADDDEFFRIALKSILIKHLNAREVIETGSFDAALDQLAVRKDISLALFDLQMPGLDSPTSLRAAREGFPDVKVVVVSSSQHREDILTALEAGVHGYLPKTLGPRELVHALDLVLRGTIFVPPFLADLASSKEETNKPSSNTILSLTPRQQQVLELLVNGNSNKSIARALGLGEGTVKIHVAALFRNLGATNRAAAAVVGSRLLAAHKEKD